MGIRLKFSLLLAGCVILPVLFTTWFMSRSFLRDQESYLNDFQSKVALYSYRLLDHRIRFLHNQIGEIVSTRRAGTEKLIDEVPGCRGAKLFPRHSLSPLEGQSTWSLLSGTEGVIRWIGRYRDHFVIVELSREWFDEILESRHGTSVQLVSATGEVLLVSENDAETISGSELFDDKSTLASGFRDLSPGLVQTLRYTAMDGSPQLGTFLRLPVEPPLMIVVKTPYATIENTLLKTYRHAMGISVVFLIVALAVGVWLSLSLTAPLETLADRMIGVARGAFHTLEKTAMSPAIRHDEVGILVRSFNNMVAELTRMRDELRRSERLSALGKFSASIAHEIKNPLGAALTNAQVARLKLDDPDPEERKEAVLALEFVEEETKRANRIVTNLMKFARQGKAPEGAIDLKVRVERSIGILRAFVEKEGVTFETSLPSEPLWSVADGDQVHEVILNLVQNALHELRKVEKKRVSLSLSREENWAVLQVADTGPGVSPDVREHLFEPFFTTKRIGEGTGLGLATCHGIVLTHKGEITVTSEPGGETVFTVRLPLSASKAEAA